MSSQQEVVEAQPRPDSSRGKNEARRLRASGRIPAVVYGAKKQAVAVSVDPKQISRILHSASGHNTIFDLNIAGENAKGMVVDWQHDPLSGKLLHIDLKRIAMDEKIRVSVPIHLVGEAPGVKQQGGLMDQVLREVEIECLPGDIPATLMQMFPILNLVTCCASLICRMAARSSLSLTNSRRWLTSQQ